MDMPSIISQAAKTRDATIRKASREAPDYPTFDAAAAGANALYRRTIDRAWRKASK